MGYKKTDPCIIKAFEDERLFVLMARDLSAPLVVVDWIKYSLSTQPPDKLHEALDAAIEMNRRFKEFNQRKEEQKKRAGLVDKLAKKNLIKTTAKPDPDMIDCDQCDGCGWYEGGPTLQTTCETCQGTGKVRNPSRPKFCAHCGGDGYQTFNNGMERDKCEECNGTGINPGYRPENSAHGFTEGSEPNDGEKFCPSSPNTICPAYCNEDPTRGCYYSNRQQDNE